MELELDFIATVEEQVIAYGCYYHTGAVGRDFGVDEAGHGAVGALVEVAYRFVQNQ